MIKMKMLQIINTSLSNNKPVASKSFKCKTKVLWGTTVNVNRLNKTFTIPLKYHGQNVV